MNNTINEVVILTGAGQIGMAIERRIGSGKTIVVGDRKKENADAVSKILNDAGSWIRHRQSPRYFTFRKTS